MRILRNILSALACLLLVYSGISTPVAQASSGGVTSMVICADGEAKMIHVDARGREVAAGHACFECCLVANDTTGSVQFQTGALRFEGIVLVVKAQQYALKATTLRPFTRGPPALV